MTDPQPLDRHPRIEDFQADYTREQILSAEALNTRAIAMQAYLQAFPAFLHMRQLTEFIQGRRYFAPAECPLGGWVLMRDLSTPKTTTVSPNVDTLYGASYLLLNQQGPVVLSVPPIPDRYYSVALLDAYFNNFAIVSPRTFGNNGGAYLIAPPGWSSEPPSGICAVLQAPTPAVCLLQRIFTRDPGEYETLHALQDAIRLTPLNRWRDGESGFPPVDLSAYDIEAMRMTRDPLRFFELTNFYTGVNPPPASDAGLTELFRTAGVGPGSRLPGDPESQQAIRQGAADAQDIMNARISAGAIRNGWRVPDPTSGLAGPHVLARAVVQATQMGLFPLQEAIYFFAYRDGENQTLHGSQRYTITFTKKELPPLREFGFWSLTMYNEVSLLVENPLNRYILRPDSPGLATAPDGSLTLHIQHDVPAGVPQGNWLPAPAGAFNVALRTYLPQAPIVDGSWFPPRIERVE
jgi:hypothetical protein